MDGACNERPYTRVVPEYRVRWPGGGYWRDGADDARRALIRYRLDHPDDRDLAAVWVVEMPPGPGMGAEKEPWAI